MENKPINADRIKSLGIIGVVIVVAASCRFWAIDFGLPHPYARPDETIMIGSALRFFSGDFNPHVYTYPGLYFYLLFACYVCYYMIGRLAGSFDSMSDILPAFQADPTDFILIDRCLSASFGVLTVLVVYGIARQLFGRRVGVLASFLLSLSFLHVRESHFGVTDVTATFFAMCAMFFVARILTAPTLKNYLLAGLLAGLAMSTKYIGVMMGAPLFVAHIIANRSSGASIRKILLDRRLLCFLAALGVAFLAGTPYVLLFLCRYGGGFLSEMRHLTAGHGGIDLGTGWGYHLRFTLFYGVGWPMLGAAIAGMVVLTIRNWRTAAVLFAFPVLMYVSIGKGHTLFVRYALPLVPFICIAAASFVGLLTDTLSRRWPAAGKTGVTVAIAVLIMAPSIRRIVDFDRLLGQEDNRLVAAGWVRQNIPPCDSWGQFSCIQQSPLQLNVGPLARIGPRYEEWTYDYATDSFVVGGEQRSDFPTYIVVPESPLPLYASTPPRVAEALRGQYALKKSFPSLDHPVAADVYDRLDAFYVPYANCDGVARPGPTIHIYQRVDR